MKFIVMLTVLCLCLFLLPAHIIVAGEVQVQAPEKQVFTRLVQRSVCTGPQCSHFTRVTGVFRFRFRNR